MNSLHKRKELVNELRKAHFPFGFQSNQGAESEYIERYKEYEAKMPNQPNNNARANNFSVTDPNNNTNYTSEFKEKYPEQPLGARGDPSALKKMHADKNFVFGYDGPDYGTNYKDDFMKKNGDNRPKPVNQKQPHISLGDSLTDFTTTYNQVYDPKKGERVSGGDPQSIRKSNMILGNDGTNYATQNSATYVPKAVENYHSKQVSNASNISLGGDKNGYCSQNKGNFYHKDANAKPVDKNRVLDFRSAHFKLGFPEQPHNYTSEAQCQYEQKPIDFHKAKGNRDSQFDLNVDGNNYFDSTYGKQFTAKNGGKAEPLKNLGQIDNVMMGAHDAPEHYLSEAKRQFGNKAGEVDRVKGKKHVACLDIGRGQGEYLTHNQDTYQDRFGQRQNNRLTPEEINKLRGLNFTTGFENPDYHVSSEKYGVGNGDANMLSKEALNAMKNTNIVQGDENPFKGNTTYKTSFHWKKGEE